MLDKEKSKLEVQVKDGDRSRAGKQEVPGDVRVP